VPGPCCRISFEQALAPGGAASSRTHPYQGGDNAKTGRTRTRMAPRVANLEAETKPSINETAVCETSANTEPAQSPAAWSPRRTSIVSDFVVNFRTKPEVVASGHRVVRGAFASGCDSMVSRPSVAAPDRSRECHLGRRGGTLPTSQLFCGRRPSAGRGTSIPLGID